MDEYISSAALTYTSSPASLSSSPSSRGSPFRNYSSSPLRQSTGQPIRKVSLFSNNGSRRSSITAESDGAPPPAGGVPSGLLHQSLTKHLNQQQERDAARARGKSRDDSDRAVMRVMAPSTSVFNPGRRRMSIQEDTRRIADYKLESKSSSTLSGRSCTSSPEAVSAVSHVQPAQARSDATSSSSPVSGPRAERKDYRTFTSAATAVTAPMNIALRSPVRTSTGRRSVSPSSSSSSSYVSVPPAQSPETASALGQQKDKQRQDEERSFVAFVNTKSGSQKGEEAMDILMDILGEDRVFDLVALDNLQSCLEQFRKEENLCIVVAGGDGTYASILNALINMRFDPMPTLATLPMGTGNDLAREFGWGGNFAPTEESFEEMFDSFQRAEPTPLDIWKVEIKPQNEVTGAYCFGQEKVQYMFNYFNLGFDAHVALGFDETRKKRPWLFRSQWINKLFYLCSVPGPAVSGMTDLYNCVMAEVDDDPISLPKDLRTLVVLNFTCYQAGLDIWGSAREAESASGFPVLWSTPSMNDSTFEVVGIGGLDHEAAVRTNMSKGYRLAQGSTIKLRLLEDVAINIDGEPQWQKAPCEVTLTRWGSVSVLRCPEKDEEEDQHKADKKRKMVKVRLGKRISKRRTRRPGKVRTGKGASWDSTAKGSFTGFLRYMLTGQV